MRRFRAAPAGRLPFFAFAADDVEPLTWALATMGRSVPAPAYVNAWRWLQATSRELARAIYVVPR